MKIRPLRADVADSRRRFAQDGRIVTAAQAPVGTKDEQDTVIDALAWLQEGVSEVDGTGTEVGGQLGDLPRIGFGLAGTVHRLLEPRGGDQLHRPRDLADVAD